MLPIRVRRIGLVHVCSRLRLELLEGRHSSISKISGDGFFGGGIEVWPAPREDDVSVRISPRWMDSVAASWDPRVPDTQTCDDVAEYRTR